MNEKTRTKQVDRAQIQTLVHLPFFAPAVAKLPVIFDNTVETACTDGEVIRWNADWFDTMEDGTRRTLLCHEALHCLLGHIWRMPVGADHDVWNQACDHAVNLMLKEFSGQVMKNGVADPFPFPTDKPPLCDPQYAGMSEEAIYHRLMSQPKPPGNAGSKAGPKQPGVGAGKPQGGVGAPKPGQGSGTGGPPHGAPSTFGQFKPSTKDTAAQKQDKSDWDGTLTQCAVCAKGRGDLPGSMDRFIGELLSPKVPWVEVLRSTLRELVQDDWNFQHPNKFFDEGGLIVPTLHSERVGAVVFCIDTSGSIDMGLLAQFKGEMQAALDDLKPSRMVEICADTRITAEREYRQGDEILKDAPGGGGTSFVAALKRCEELEPRPRCVVYLTDGDGEHGEEPPFEVIWCLYGGCKTAPFGTVVEVA